MVRVIWVLVDFSLLARFLRRSESISIGTKESKRASKQVVGPKTVVIGVMWVYSVDLDTRRKLIIM